MSDAKTNITDTDLTSNAADRGSSAYNKAKGQSGGEQFPVNGPNSSGASVAVEQPQGTLRPADDESSDQSQPQSSQPETTESTTSETQEA